MARKKKTDDTGTDEDVKTAEVVEEKVEAPPAPLTAIEKINNFLFKEVKFLTRKPPAKLTRTAEDVAERKAVAQAKRERRNAKRLQNRG